MRILVLGCGYVGERIVRMLGPARPGVTTRSPARARALEELGADARVLDAGDAGAVAAVARGCAVAIHSVPPGPAGDVTPALIAGLLAAGVPACVYLGSTSVYPAVVPGLCDEETPVAPAGAGTARLAAEASLRASGLRVALLRIAAIYGPGRGLHVRLRAGAHRVAGDGTNYVSRVHVDDLAAVALAAGAALLVADPGTIRIYNVADAAPMTARAASDLVSTRLGLPPALSVPVHEAPESLRGDRRVSSARVHAELGLRLRYPTLADGLEQLLAEEDNLQF